VERIFKPPGVPLPVLVGFRDEILPVLVAYWVAATVLYLPVIRYRKPSNALADYNGLDSLGKDLDELMDKITAAAK
jgi:hypothetical protein